MKKKYVKPTAKGVVDWEGTNGVIPAVVAAAAGAAAASLASAAVSKMFENEFIPKVTTNATSKVEVLYE